MKVVVRIMIGLWVLSMSALAEPVWRVQPTTCVVEKISQPCPMELDIRLLQESDSRYCLFLADQQLRCDLYFPGPHQHQVVLVDDTWLTLQTLQGDELARVALELKALQPVLKRRRIHNPWSFF